MAMPPGETTHPLGDLLRLLVRLVTVRLRFVSSAETPPRQIRGRATRDGTDLVSFAVYLEEDGHVLRLPPGPVRLDVVAPEHAPLTMEFEVPESAEPVEVEVALGTE